MLTVFRILFGKNVKLGNGLADKGSSLSFFMLYNHIKTVIGAFASMPSKIQSNDLVSLFIWAYFYIKFGTDNFIGAFFVFIFNQRDRQLLSIYSYKTRES